MYVQLFLPRSFLPGHLHGHGREQSLCSCTHHCQGGAPHPAPRTLPAWLQGALKRTLGPFGLTCVGVGLMLGAGIYVAPGHIAKDITGPAVCLAYVIASVSAMLSCLVYAEFAVDMPLAGAA